MEEAINLDALMLQDAFGDLDQFEDSLTGPGGDEIIFSIRQIPNPGDPDGYYATGSELFVLNADGSAGFLAHGGHVWDHLYSLTAFEIFGGVTPLDPNYGVLEINAIEAIGEFAVPEPGALMMALMALAAGAAIRRPI